MASSVDNFSDLEELGIDVNESFDKQSQEFTQAANHLPKILPTLENKTLLALYGYYKQATEGPCKTPKPSWYDFQAKSKWEAWNKLEDMPKSQAKALYTDTIKKLDPTFNNSLNDKSPQEQWVKVSALKAEDISTCDLTVADYIKKGNYEEVQNHLKNHSDSINELDGEGLGLVHWATDCGNLYILKLLKDSGANLNLLDGEGQTPLHYAASCGHADLIKFLLEHGARIDLVDNEGNSACDVAEDAEIKGLLL